MAFSRISRYFKGIFNLLARRPIASFIVIVIALFGVIFLANKLRTPKAEEATQAPSPRTVSVFTVGKDAPNVPAQAEVKDAGVMNIVAVTPGIVRRVYVAPGARVRTGQTVFQLTDDYGTNSGAIRAEIARQNQELTEKNYGLNKEILRLQERVTHDSSTGHLRKIAADTLTVEKRSLKNDVEVSRLNAALAAAENAPLTPRALMNGVITSIPVSLGDYVTPGTVLATLSGTNQETILEAKLPLTVALLFDPNGKNSFRFENQEYPLTPRFFSPTEDGDGLITLQFAVPTDIATSLSDHSFVDVSLSLGSDGGDATLVPIDALFQEREGSSVLTLDENNKAATKPVVVKRIVGNFALLTGLNLGERIVTDRLVAPGDEVIPSVQ